MVENEQYAACREKQRESSLNLVPVRRWRGRKSITSGLRRGSRREGFFESGGSRPPIGKSQGFEKARDGEPSLTSKKGRIWGHGLS